MSSLQQVVLFVIGCISLVLGIGLMVWATVQKKAAAGVSLKDVSELLKQIANLMDAIARLIPNQAARVGFVLILVGVFLIFYPIYWH
jgi:uncharacterized membrane protein